MRVPLLYHPEPSAGLFAGWGSAIAESKLHKGDHKEYIDLWSSLEETMCHFSKMSHNFFRFLFCFVRTWSPVSLLPISLEPTPH